MDENHAKLAAWVQESHRTAFFGGAGVSTESGIPDFRGVDGLYRQKYDQPPETILSHGYFLAHTGEFYRFYRDKMIAPNAQPNAAHRRLAEWEAQGRLSAVITQNIDGLHQAAGSRNVLELHGSVHRNHCLSCNRAFGLDAITSSNDIPHCDCGGIIKPDVVLYGESLEDGVIAAAIEALSSADLLIVAGTSLSVYPAAGLINLYRGNRMVLINLTPTSRDERANLILRASVGQVLGAL